MATLSLVRGIVLSKRDWREADRLYCVYTKEYGKMEFLGRGARKPLAKLSPHLEFFSEADFLIVHGIFYETIAGVENRKSFLKIYEQITKTLLAHQSLSAIDRLISFRQSDIEFYFFLDEWLTFLQKCPPLSSTRANFFFSAFLLKSITLLGHKPEVVECLECREHLQSQKYQWHSLKGGVI
jgi:DNA repair protein RecO (recombination protein O)